MRTDPFGDAWDFIVGAQPEQAALGDLRWPFVGLFAGLLMASLLIALVAWRRELNLRGSDVGPGPGFAWLCRWLVGILWFQAALRALPLPVSSVWQAWTERLVDGAAWPWVGWIVSEGLLPNRAVIGPAVFAVEIGLSVSLMLGLFVRPAAIVGAGAALALWIGLYRDAAFWPWLFVLLAAAQGMVAIVGGGYSLGLDALLARLRRGRTMR